MHKCLPHNRRTTEHDFFLSSFIIFMIFVALATYLPIKVYAQGVGINPSGGPPDPSAALDINFNNKGVLLPRLTTAERTAISNPALGLLIFNVTTNCFEAYVNNVWSTVSCPCPAPLATTAGVHTATASQITWNWNTVSGATGYQWNTVNTYPGSGVNVVASPSYTQTGLACGTAYNLYVWAYNTCGYSSGITLTQSTSACWSCGFPLPVTHTAGSVAAVSKTVNYGTVMTSLSGAGKCWITQNLGSGNQATSATDNSEASAGWLWQFGRQQGFKHDGSTRTPNTAWVSSFSVSGDWSSSEDPCTLELGSGWRIPTGTEWTNAISNGGWGSISDAYNSVLKLHTGGLLFPGDGTLGARGAEGPQWSSTAVQRANLHTSGAYFGSSPSEAYGMALRCIKD